MASFERTPDELVRHILSFLSPEDNLTAQLVSRQLHGIANDPLIWRQHCADSFVHWNKHHDIEAKFARPVLETDWKRLWVIRKNGNQRVARLLDGIIQTRVGQARRTELIAELGIDAKDYLLDQMHADPSQYDDVLARRYFARRTLASIHRGIAVGAWMRFQSVPNAPAGIEEACGAFDMFFLHDQPQDIDYIKRTIDDYAGQFIKDTPQFEQLNTRQKGMRLLRWLGSKKYVGTELPESEYRYLKNCLIGHALSETEHTSLPIIASAIYVSVAKRLRMETACVAVPGHVYVVIRSPPDLDLDGNPAANASREQITMYIDPVRSNSEITEEQILGHVRQLQFVTFPWANYPESLILEPTPVAEIVRRIARNLQATREHFHSFQGTNNEQRAIGRLRTGSPSQHIEMTKYAAMWANFIARRADLLQWSNNISELLEMYALTYMEDHWIVKKYLHSCFEHHVAQNYNERRVLKGWDSVSDIMKLVENLDARPTEVNRRYTEEMRTEVRYRIGQVVMHKQYRYVAVVNGWSCGSTQLPRPHSIIPDENGDNNDEANANEGNSSNKILYTCLRPSVDRLKVAQDDIEILTDPEHIPDEIFDMAGKYFKRFDPDTCTFVSNIKDMYPDD